MMSAMTSCEKQILTDSPSDYSEYDGDRTRVTFAVSGYSQGNTPHPAAVPPASMFSVTRAASLNADGKDMTDIWLLDYQNGQLVQQLHQQAGDPDFGSPSLTMDYGQHTLYFVASRGKQPLLSTADHTISWQTPSDTFYKDYEVNVISTSNGNRAVTLDRIVTRLRLIFTDAVNEKTSTVNITPGTWYHGWDYVNGTPANEKTNYTSSITIPTNELGKTGLQVNIYGFSTAEEWQTTVSVTSKHANGEIIGSTTLTNVPFKANRITEYAGPLFGSEGSMVLSLDADWDDAYTGTW
jgi:hypothetical protein